jgi:hypothetical protein
MLDLQTCRGWLIQRKKMIEGFRMCLEAFEERGIGK